VVSAILAAVMDLIRAGVLMDAGAQVHGTMTLFASVLPMAAQPVPKCLPEFCRKVYVTVELMIVMTACRWLPQ